MPSNRPFTPQPQARPGRLPVCPDHRLADDDGISNRFRVWDRALERHVLPSVPRAGRNAWCRRSHVPYAHFERFTSNSNRYDWYRPHHDAVAGLLGNLFYMERPRLRIMGREVSTMQPSAWSPTAELRRRACVLIVGAPRSQREFQQCPKDPAPRRRRPRVPLQLNHVSWADDESSGESVDDEVADARRHCAIAYTQLVRRRRPASARVRLRHGSRPRGRTPRAVRSIPEARMVGHRLGRRSGRRRRGPRRSQANKVVVESA